MSCYIRKCIRILDSVPADFKQEGTLSGQASQKFDIEKKNNKKKNKKKQNEPPHDKTNKMACAPSEDSDQSGHLPSLIRIFAVRSMGSKGTKLSS